jgi:superfamily II DNA helicase RecQ
MAFEDEQVRREARAKTRAMFELPMRRAAAIAIWSPTSTRPSKPAARRADECRGVGSSTWSRASQPTAKPRDERAKRPPPNVELFMRLRALRRALADEEGVPRLHRVQRRSPHAHGRGAADPTKQASWRCAGVGPAKLARYGQQFLRVLREG